MSKKEKLIVRDRRSGQLFEEDVYGGGAINFLYGGTFLGNMASSLICKCPIFSALAGYWYRSPQSRPLIKSFVERFQVNTSEFASSIDSFSSFNDFFIRKLTPASRPIAEAKNTAVMPADGRYLFFPEIENSEGFYIKGQTFNIEKLLGSKELADQFRNGTMVIARLCPKDYHRFHFPVDSIASKARLINGYLYSVNPQALRYNFDILNQNKRYITEIHNPLFGNLLYIEIGATNVGSVIQTYNPNLPQEKGGEKGYFQFGASCVVLIFKEKSIRLDDDLLKSAPYQETLCLMGQSLGTASILKT